MTSVRSVRLGSFPFVSLGAQGAGLVLASSFGHGFDGQFAGGAKFAFAKVFCGVRLTGMLCVKRPLGAVSRKSKCADLISTCGDSS